MTDFHGDDLRDPQPPVPGEAERAAVGVRAAELVRRRRFAEASGGVVAIAAVAVVVAVLTAAGPGTRVRPQAVAAANSSSGDAGVDGSAPTTTAAPEAVPAPTTLAPVAAPDPAPTDPSGGTSDGTGGPARAPTVTVSGHVSGIPQGTTITVRFIGAGGDFATTVDPSGNFAISGLPPGVYTGSWESGTTSAVGQIGSVDLSTNQYVSFFITS